MEIRVHAGKGVRRRCEQANQCCRRHGTTCFSHSQLLASQQCKDFHIKALSTRSYLVLAGLHGVLLDGVFGLVASPQLSGLHPSCSLKLRSTARTTRRRNPARVELSAHGDCFWDRSPFAWKCRRSTNTLIGQHIIQMRELMRLTHPETRSLLSKASPRPATKHTAAQQASTASFLCGAPQSGISTQQAASATGWFPGTHIIVPRATAHAAGHRRGEHATGSSPCCFSRI